MYLAVAFGIVFLKADIIFALLNPVCRPGLCNNNGTCIERPFTQGGFLCRCTEDFHGARCDNRLPEVSCQSNRIILTVEKSLIREEVNEVDKNFVYLGRGQFGDSKCVSRDVGNNLVVILRTPFDGCGTNSSKDGSNFVYRNRLYLDTTRNSSVPNGQRIVLLDWSCEYKSKYDVTYPFPVKPAVNRPERQVVYGRFTMVIKVYRSPDYREQSRLRPPAIFAIGQRLYAEVELMTSAHHGFVVSIKSCRASDVPNSATENPLFTHDIINNGCPSIRDPSVVIHQSGKSTRAQFSFSVFQWSSSPAPLYLHCLVSVCNITRFEQDCQPFCLRNTSSAESRVRRAADEVNRSPDLQLTIGPYLVSNKEVETLKNPENNETSTIEYVETLMPKSATTVKPEYIVLSAFAMIGLICIVAISALIWRRRRWAQVGKGTNKSNNRNLSSRISNRRTISTVIEEDLHLS